MPPPKSSAARARTTSPLKLTAAVVSSSILCNNMCTYTYNNVIAGETCLHVYTDHARRKRHELDIIVRNKCLRVTAYWTRERRKKWRFKYIGAVRIFNGFFDDEATSRRSESRITVRYIIHTYIYIVCTRKPLMGFSSVTVYIPTICI